MCGRGSAEVKLCKKTYNDEALPLLELALLGINRSAQGSRREKASPILHAFCSTHAFIHSCRRGIPHVSSGERSCAEHPEGVLCTLESKQAWCKMMF